MNPVGFVALCLRMVDPLGPTDIDPDDARDRACEVTGSGRICNPTPSEPPSRAPDVPNPGGGTGPFGQLLVVLLVLLLLIALAWLVKRWLDGGDGRRRDADAGDALEVDEAVDEHIDARVVDHEMPPARWRRLASEARSSGDHREAVRCQYRALIGDLARSGYVDEIPGRTSGEERDQVAEIAPLLGDVGRDVARQFDIAASTFDTAWFDDGDVTAADGERFLSAERAVLDVVLSGKRKRADRHEMTS